MSLVTAALVKKTVKDLKRQLPVILPKDFTWRDNPLTSTLVTDYEGGFQTNFDVSDFQYTEGTTYWVSASRGSDENPGTKEQPLARLWQALEKSDVGTVMIEEGIYGRNNGIALNLENRIGNSEKSVSIKAVTGHKVYLTQHDQLSWSLHSGNVYRHNRSGVRQVLDLNRPLSPNGDEFVKLEQKNTIEDVQNTEDSWYTDGSVVYVHLKGGVAPSRNNTADLLGTDNIRLNGGGVLYLEGLTVIGGRVFRVDGTETQTPNVFAKDCKFIYANDTGSESGVRINGAKLAIFQNCVAANNTDDGFDYHWLHGVKPDAIEVDCVGRNNGTTGATENGSTMHEGGRIIRVNGVYFGNAGPNVADVNDGTESLNYGVQSFASLTTTEPQNSDFTITNEAKMWLDNCKSYSSKYSLDGRPDSVIYVRQTEYEGEVKDGTVVKMY